MGDNLLMTLCPAEKEKKVNASSNREIGRDPEISKKQTLSKEEIDRIFEKQAKYEEANAESSKGHLQEWRRSEWLRRKTRNREYSDDPLLKERLASETHRTELASARIEAREIQKVLSKRWNRKYLEVIKQGVLEGAIHIHETDFGFMIDTPRDKVQSYVLQHPMFKSKLPTPKDLEEGRFLLGTVDDLVKEQFKNVRDSLVEEFEAETPTDFMLIDLAVSNYMRTMQATRMEMNSLWYADDYRMEMFEIMTEGLQPYIHDCQNQFLKILRILKNRGQIYSPSTITYETYSRTDINLEKWGMPLLYALAEITERKQQEIGIDEIKQAMTKHLGDINAEAIPNSWIGYALRRYGFTDKIHANDGNRYSISRERVQMLLSCEGLKL